jgi:hypothetical protein
MGAKGVCCFVILFCCVIDIGFSAVDSASLLWPMPSELSIGSGATNALDPDKFLFSTAINSALLDQAFQRYKGIIFQAPVPFYLDGAEQDVKTLFPMLNVTVSGGDDVLRPDTDESCKLLCVAIDSSVCGTTVCGMIYPS